VKDDIAARLTELRDNVRDARSMPMSASAVLNRAELLEMIDALEAAIDETLSHATTVVGDREAVVASGQSEAEEILRQARSEQDRLVSDTDVYKLAQERSEELIESARREAAETRAELDDYVESHLANFELTLDKTLQTVRRGRARLTGGHASGLADDSDVAGMELPEHLRRGDS
jgi:hypothetical protein